MRWRSPKEIAQDRVKPLVHFENGLCESPTITILHQSRLLDVFKSVPYAKGEKILLWDLPGHGYVTRDTCGKTFVNGCDHVAAHESGKVRGRLHKYNCSMKGCPECFETWALKEAEKGLIRIACYVSGSLVVKRVINKLKTEFKTKSKREFHENLVFWLEDMVKSAYVSHFVVSPPQDQKWDSVASFRAARNKAYSIARSRGCRGGAVIAHPYRLRCKKCGKRIPDYKKECSCGCSAFEWVFAPHFHIVGFGYIENVKEGFLKDGWVVKNLGVRESVFRTFQYLLSHCGVSILHTVTWFGELGYHAERMRFIPKVGGLLELCAECGRHYRPLVWLGATDRPPPVLEYCKTDSEKNELLLEVTDWRVM